MANGLGPITAIAIVGALIIVGVGFTYYSTSNSISSLSAQNASLNHQLAGLNQQNSNLNQQLGSLQQQVSTVEQRTLTVETQTETYVSVVTSVATTSITSTSTVTVYPVPDNVTILFTHVSGGYSYVVTAGSNIFAGSRDTQFVFQIAPVFQGETIAISASETGLAGCSMGQTVTALLYLNGQVVAQGTQICTGSNIQISFIV